MSDHVALTLDGATATTPTSAMRWVPEPEKAPESHVNARWGGPGVGVTREPHPTHDRPSAKEQP